MNFENLKQVIDFAIEKEKEAAEFYDSLSKEESMSGSKEMFAEFAQEERKHQAMLEKLGKEDIDKGIGDYKFKWIPDLKRSNYLVDMEYEKGMGFKDILALAMKREEKALELYNQLLGQAETEAGKKIFKILCQEEAKHKNVLETMYDDYMAKMGD
jgi:rubrerythrin